MTIYNLRSENNQDQNEIDMSTVLGGQKVSYTGTAEITNQIIEAGLEIPTQIHETPEEALNLHLFDPEVQPFIKKIFLEKYRNVVSLHSLDAGDFSTTLGYTALRLIHTTSEFTSSAHKMYVIWKTCSTNL